VRYRVQAFAVPTEIDEFADDIRRVFQALGRSFSPESLAGECSPQIDVYETDDALEVVTDLPGVSPKSVHIVAKGDALLIAGEKTPRRTGGDPTFHLVERGYGRFARVVRLGRTCNPASARATFAHGELRISIPKVEERRGRRIPIAIT
jgi:HSP20 family protein